MPTPSADGMGAPFCCQIGCDNEDRISHFLSDEQAAYNCLQMTASWFRTLRRKWKNVHFRVRDTRLDYAEYIGYSKGTSGV
jgi:hypothetical protein